MSLPPLAPPARAPSTYRPGVLALLLYSALVLTPLLYLRYPSFPPLLYLRYPSSPPPPPLPPPAPPLPPPTFPLYLSLTALLTALRLSLTRLSLGRLSPAARRTLTRCESVPVLSAAASPRSQSRSLTPSPSPEDRRLSPLPVSIFRLIYNLSTSLLLHRLFRTTLLPPPLGSGTTRACWSLSLIDDPLRAPLALAFLLQLSLESSSLLTHLLLTRLRPRPGYVLERLLAASLLLLSFVLTSTRRLGALGILYANLSQACLNLLQISLALRRPTGLPFRLLFLLLVLLPFLHLRIYSFLAVILPSAVHESGPYIAQLGAVTDPRVAKIACAAFGALGVGFFLMNVLYVGRLWGNAQVREQWRSARPKMD